MTGGRSPRRRAAGYWLLAACFAIGGAWAGSKAWRRLSADQVGWTLAFALLAMAGCFAVALYQARAALRASRAGAPAARTPAA